MGVTRFTAPTRPVPLPEMLDIERGDRVAFDNRPPEFAAATSALPAGALLKRHVRFPLDVVVAFTTGRRPLEARIGVLAGALDVPGALWIAWPRADSDVPTDLDEHAIRELALAEGLVEAEACALDAVWCALKFVRRA